MSEEISDSEKNSKNLFRVPLKQNRRLLSTISVQKSIENERKIFLIIYKHQEKFPKIIPSHWSKFEDYFRLLQSRNWSKTCGRYFWYYLSPRKKFQKIFPSHWSKFEDYFQLFQSRNWSKNAWKIFLILYQSQEKFQWIIPSHLKRLERPLSIIAL